MPGFIKISEAASIALHSMALIAARDGITTVHDISERLGVSEFHLSKVMQRLSKSRLVRSTRGPGGGFTLGKKSDAISLLDVYEAIEGPLEKSNCLLRHQACGSGKCILGDILGKVSKSVSDYLGKTSLSEISVPFS